jgi:hypothetical protein
LWKKLRKSILNTAVRTNTCASPVHPSRSSRCGQSVGPGKRVIHQLKGAFHHNPVARDKPIGKLASDPIPMQASHSETRTPHPHAKRSRYRVVGHQEAGLFDWALKYLNNRDWRIEPVAGTVLV